jgi:hypothetical protein
MIVRKAAGKNLKRDRLYLLRGSVLFDKVIVFLASINVNRNSTALTRLLFVKRVGIRDSLARSIDATSLS